MLREQHIKYLNDRGIPAEAAASAGYRSIEDPEKLVAVGYTASQANHVPGLLVPLFDVQGELVSHQYRADAPRLNRAGKALKFDNPKGARNRVTFPGTAAHAVHHKDLPLVVIEGPVKALSVWVNLGLPAATLTGTWSWVGKQGLGAGAATVLADWREMDLAGRQVWVAFDSDVMTNPMVHSAAQQLGAMLSNRKAEVRYLLLPQVDEDKAGLDDWLAQGGTREEAEALLVTQLPAMPEKLRGREARQEIASQADIPYTDKERAEAWWRYAGQYDIRRTQREDSWHYYDGARWVDYASKDTGLHISVIKYLSQLTEQVKELLPTAEADERKALRELSNSLESTYTAQQVATWAKKMDDLYVPWGFFDPAGDSSYLLNCANGTVDLRSLDLRPHDPDDRLTGICPTIYDPDAEAPDWLAFMEEILPDQEVRDFVQRVLGMSLIADPGVQGAFVFHGAGANGKGAMMRVVSRVLGNDYASSAPRATLQKTKNEEHPTAWMEFRGRRLMWLDEMPGSSGFSEHLFKELTGGGDIKARGMRQDFVQFRPTHSLFITTNYLPEVTSDLAMWRRLHRVPFDVEIPVEKRDENREVRILRDESSGVLNWLLQGFQDFWELSDKGNGPGRLGVPDAVREATEEWKQGQDHLLQFMTAELSPAADTATRIAEVRTQYVKWAQEQDVPFSARISQNDFSAELQRRGFDVRQNSRWQGVKGSWLIGHQLPSGGRALEGPERVSPSAANPF